VEVVMFGEFESAVRRSVEISESGPKADKVMPLAEAVHKLVEPGMNFHVAHCYARPCATVNEIARQFWGTEPGFTVSALGFTGTMVALFFGGLVKKAVATFYGDSYPMPGPNPVYQKAFREGSVEMENWTILTFSLRLLAGAMDFEFIPAKSLAGTTMEKDNREDCFTVDTPEGESLGMVRALRPELALVHAWAADPAGNVICSPPYAENAASARSASGGVLVTVEKIVSPEFVRRHSHFVKIPSYLVRSVSLAPMGTHPGGLSNYGLENEFTGYEVDREFLMDLREKCRDERSLSEWMEKWILGCRDQEEYLYRLGHERIWYLNGKSARDSWKSELEDRLPALDKGPEYNPFEMMVAVGARIIVEKALAGGYRTILAGVGASNLAAWLAYYDLMERGHDCDLMAEIGFYGYSPQPADPYIFNLRNVPNCRMLTDVNDVLGSLAGAKTNRCIGSLGAGQVDRHGNVNSTMVPEMKLFLVGSGGAADVAAGAREVVILIDHLPARLVEEVPYVTCPGDRITAVVTTKGVLEKRDGGLVLSGYFPVHGGDGSREVEEIKEGCGWDLEVAADPERIERPTIEELRSTRMFDPHGFFLGKGD
jgi:acyl CoA:acetate/3-ketoacid CoA transferase alpha subunit/acyl CoA:acetate/3-ketoacid CoA transferase beta subunit